MEGEGLLFVLDGRGGVGVSGEMVERREKGEGENRGGSGCAEERMGRKWEMKAWRGNGRCGEGRGREGRRGERRRGEGM